MESRVPTLNIYAVMCVISTVVPELISLIPACLCSAAGALWGAENVSLTGLN